MRKAELVKGYAMRFDMISIDNTFHNFNGFNALETTVSSFGSFAHGLQIEFIRNQLQYCRIIGLETVEIE